jgi:rod shape determining protein RodA
MPAEPLISLPQRQWRHFDWTLLGLLLATTAYGLVVLWGATRQVSGLEGYFARQSAWFAVGVVALAAALVVDFDWLRKLAWPLYLLALALLLFVVLQPHRVKGAASWIRFPGGVGFQPAEFAKLGVVALLARALSEERLSDLPTNRQFTALAKLGTIVVIPVGLILAQPDLGTAAVFLPVFLAMAYAAGLSRKLLLGIALAAGLAFAAGYPFLKPYQQARLAIHLNPESDPRGRGYNIIQAKIALGSGQLAGKGLGKGTQTYFRFLPEHQTDFIFNSLGEQLGLLGCMALLALYLAMLWRALAAASTARNHFGALLVAGLASIFAAHVFLNVMIACQLLPVTGLPLPLMSAGGSFLVANYIIFGLVLNVGMRRHHFQR